ncbi:hypothetical protein [Maribacter sp. HTCC2170]|uniref:hypothetical protein n=1 Tax=Maribacter sp. (strain HTCC2170 / KCCM 42371) TaxID=313603 RepID=UPI00006ADA64|nr:hypothetical protein [Maribacter sp. HTCC2170]EAQ99850.1 hypothetical protein FB2170_16051 [Maribacter sp. HTCC2170]
MKTFVKLFLSIVILLTTVVGMAHEPRLSIVGKNDAKSLIFKLDSPSNKTRVQFLDQNDNVIYSENISDISYRKKFNLKYLNDGIYFFETEDEIKTIVYKISLVGGIVKIVDRKEEAKPVFRIMEKKVFVNLLNIDNDMVEVKVKDSMNRVIFEEDVKNQISVEKAFNFENALQDNYTIVIKDGKIVYYKNFVVK